MISESEGGKARLCLCGTSRAGGPEEGRRMNRNIGGEQLISKVELVVYNHFGSLYVQQLLDV